jgi:hypothetical protein
MSALEVVDNKVVSCRVSLEPGEPSEEQLSSMPLEYAKYSYRKIPKYLSLQGSLAEGMVANGVQRWNINNYLIRDEDAAVPIGWARLKVYAPHIDTKAIFGHIELDESKRGQGLGKAAYVAAQLSLPEGYLLIAGRPRTDAAEHVWEGLVRDGLATGHTQGWICGPSEMKPATNYEMNPLTQESK